MRERKQASLWSKRFFFILIAFESLNIHGDAYYNGILLKEDNVRVVKIYLSTHIQIFVIF